MELLNSFFASISDFYYDSYATLPPLDNKPLLSEKNICQYRGNSRYMYDQDYYNNQGYRT